MKKTRTRIGSILLALTLVLTLMPITAMAATSVEYLDEDGTPTYTSSEINVTEINTENAPKKWVNGWYVVSGDVTITDRITVNGDVHLILADNCTLNAQKGISVTSGNRLTIYGQSKKDSTDSTVGRLIAGTDGTIENGYAGIGGDYGNTGVYAHGDIIINSGSVTAQGGNWAAGIGGGISVSSKTDPNGIITINGGTVEATGGRTGAGIGCGSANHVTGGDITITGGTVTAQGGNFAAGIGGGNLDDHAPGRSITISGGTVEATGGSQAAGIGSGYHLRGGVNRSIGAIKINGRATVTANGGAGAAGIGSSYEGAATGAILIGVSATVEANGGGSEQDGSGVLAAGAGIGSGGNGGQAGKITITGGTVEATGGTGHLDASGAGIGSGGSAFDSSGSNAIVISAGTITATGGGTSGTQAAGIGSGSGKYSESTSGDFSTDRTVSGETVPGKAVIRTNSITDNDDKTGWNAVVFEDNTGTVYGDVELGRGLAVKKNETLTVPEGSSLNVPEGKTLRVNGELTNEGTLLVEGTLNNNGTLTTDGSGQTVIFGKLEGTSSDNTPVIKNPEASYTGSDGKVTYYATIGEALTAANSSGGLVKLLKDATLTGSAAPWYIGNNITLDLGGDNTLEYASDLGFAVSPTFHFTIQNGTYENTADSANKPVGIEATKSHPTTEDGQTIEGCTVTIRNAKIIAPYACVYSQGYATIEVYDSELISTSQSAIYGLGPNNKITVGRSTITGGTHGVYQKAYDTKYDDMFPASTFIIQDNSSIAATNGAAVYIASNEGIAQTIHTLTVTDSKITGPSGIEVQHTNVEISGSSTMITATQDGGYALRSTFGGTDTYASGTLEINGGIFTGLIGIQDPEAGAESAAVMIITAGNIDASSIDGNSALVTFNSNGGSAVPSLVVAKGDKITLPSTTYADHTFHGWYANNIYAGSAYSDYTVNSTVTLVAQWQMIPTTTPSTPSTPSTPTTPSTSDKDDDDDDDGYSITIPASSSVRGGSISVNPRRADKGDTVTITVTPDDGYVLKDLTVTARSGGEVDLTKKNSTQYTFKMPAGAVVIEVSFAESDSAAEVEMSFADVAEDFWAYSEIQWAFDNGYMNGTSATTFNPSGTVSRQQVWMILARMAGANPADMAAAKAWAVENGISDGTNPGGGVTRQQLVALLYRFAAQNGYDTNAKADLSGYPDVASLASYAADAMAWSVANGIIGGTTQGTLNPAGTANRAQFAVILWRFYQTTAV